MFDGIKALIRKSTAFNAKPGTQVFPIGRGATVNVDANGDILFATCIEILSKQIAQQKWGVYDKDNADASNIGHLTNYVLNVSPYQGLTAYDFWNYMEKQRLGTGNAVAYILYDELGRLQGLVPLDGSRVKVYWDNADLFKGERKIVYEYSDTVKGESVVMLPEEVLHVKAFSANGIVGRPAINVLRETLRSNAEVESAMRSAVANGFHGSIILQYTSDLSTQKQETLQRKVADLLRNPNR